MSPSSIYDPLVTFQAMADSEWRQELQAYDVQSDLWRSANIQLRDMGKPLTPKPVKPLRRIYTKDSHDNISSNLIDDPSVHEPELPPAAPTISSPPITVGQTTADNAAPYILQLLAHVIDQNNQILAALKPPVK